MDAFTVQITALAEASDVSGRRKIMDTLHRLAYSMETAEETRDRFGFLHLQTAIVKIGFDLGLFKYLAQAAEIVTVDDATEKTGSERDLLVRILRYLAAHGVVDEVGKEQYRANKITQNLATKVAEAGICHWFGTVAPQYQQLPVLLRKTEYKNPIDETHTAFHEAWHTSLSPFAWFEGQPELLGHFNDYMATRAQPQHSWLQVYPVREEFSKCSPDRPVYVNVGGGVGHQCAEFINKFPDLPGRVILQDLPHSIAHALNTPGVENMSHDFFEPQPVRGAKVYYLRSVLHDHPKHKVSQIIQNIKAAMAPDSILLLDEIILPEIGVNAFVSALDMSMLTAFASMERTEAQWRAILAEEGLVLKKTHIYNPLIYEGVLDVRFPS